MFKHTLAVLDELESRLKCCLCDKLADNASIRCGCDHFFCHGCSNLLPDHCPKCGLPFMSTEVESYEIINSVIDHYLQLNELLKSPANDTVRSDAQTSSTEVNKQDSSRMGRSPRRAGINKTLTVDSSDSRSSDKTNKLHKRNVKGETPLHVASIKGKTEDVARFLDMGADPNNKDNAGWTPLHEACNHGFIEIAKLLLEHGANVNSQGPDAVTPLHEAVANVTLDMVKLLVSYGADKTIKTTKGLSPLDLAEDVEIKEALQSSAELISLKPTVSPNSTTIVLTSTGLNDCDKIQFQKCGKLLKAKLIDTFTDEVTHLVAADNGQRTCSRTLKYLHAVLKGTWVISTDWVEECLAKEKFVKEDRFEIKGTFQFPDCYGPNRGRRNAIDKKPGLFSGCHFYFHGKFIPPSPPKNELTRLVQQAGGIILDDMPNQDLNVKKTIPFHMKTNSKLNGASYFIIYCENVNNSHRSPQNNKLSSSFIRTLPQSWLLSCLTKFTIEDP